MNRKKVKILLFSLLSVISIISSIASLDRYYTENNEFKMLYMVKPDESIKDIAAKFKVDIKTIESINNCKEYVATGTVLKIPIRE